MAPSALKIILDLEKVNTLNAEGCPACGRKFSLGEMAVLACGAWEGGPKYIHENEAVFDKKKRHMSDESAIKLEERVEIG